MPSSLMLLSNPYRPDPRVLMEARALKSAGYEVTLVAWDREQSRAPIADEGPLRAIRLGPRCPQRNPGKMLTRLPRFWLKALKAARRLKFDAVHANDFDTLPLGLVTGRLHGKPVLYDAHELYAKMIENDVGPISKLIWRCERALSRRAEGMITVSESLANELPVGKGGRARVVTTSQDPSVAESADVSAIRREYGLSGFVISYLGALEPGRFVEEASTSFESKDGVTLVVAGDGTLKETVVREASRNPAVKYIGVVDVDEALRITWASDLVLAMMDPSNPNNVVGTPGKIINAMALGKPLVTTEGLEIAKKVAAAGCGLVIPFSKSAFTETVMKVKADPEALKAMGSRGREHYGKEYSWERSKDELLKAYQALLGTS